jgi:hypothetical protein
MGSVTKSPKNLNGALSGILPAAVAAGVAAPQAPPIGNDLLSDPLLDSVKLRLTAEQVDGLRSAMGIARLLGHHELVTLMEEE